MEIPLTVIAGYLGAGKTTLLNHWLGHNDGRRIAVLVNDFGRLNIDAALVTARDAAVMQFANGCVCCSLANGFAQALAQVAQQSPPVEWVLVEASGVSWPDKLAQYGHVPPFRLDTILVLADVETVQQKARDRYVGSTILRQLRTADIVILNKTDLVTPSQVKAVKAWLESIVPDARILETVNAVVPLALLTGAGRVSDERTRRDVQDDADAHEADHAEAYASWSYTNDAPLTRERVLAFVESLPPDVLRAKGILYLQDDPDNRYVLQVVGRRHELERERPWGESAPHSELVVIGCKNTFDSSPLCL